MAYFALGWLFFGLGAAGTVLPVLPTTPFMILALWCFSQSSERFRDWLYNHRTFGPSLQLWQRHRIIPLPVKLTAWTAMALSFAYLLWLTPLSWPWLAATGAIMAFGAVFVGSYPSRLPAPSLPESAD